MMGKEFSSGCQRGQGKNPRWIRSGFSKKVEEIISMQEKKKEHLGLP